MESNGTRALIIIVKGFFHIACVLARRYTPSQLRTKSTLHSCRCLYLYNNIGLKK